MSKGDELDTLLSDPSVIDAEWEAIGAILSIMNILELPIEKRIETVNNEIRHYFGHTLANVFRDSYEPDYVDPILIATASRLNIDKSQQTAKDIEDIILTKIIQTFRNRPQKTDQKHFGEIKNIDEYDEFLEFCKNRDGVFNDSWAAAIGIMILPVIAVGPIAAMIYKMGDTNWKRVVPAISLIASIRKRIALEEALLR